MDYIYAKLNERLEQQEHDYIPTDIESTSTIDAKKIDDNKYQLHVNTQNIVRFIKISDDSDDVQIYRLYAYNISSGKYDIQVGDDIVISNNPGGGTGELSNIKYIDICGQKVPARIDESGQIQLDYIPSIAISDKIQVVNPDGSIIYEQSESIIDGNDGV